jgi:hypothetical protein
MTSLVSCCARIVNHNKWPTVLHDRADVTVGYNILKKENIKILFFFRFKHILILSNIYTTGLSRRFTTYIKFSPASYHIRYVTVALMVPVMFSLYKLDLVIISLKINLFSPWYSWQIAELVINNNHALTHSLTQLWTPITEILYTPFSMCLLILGDNICSNYFHLKYLTNTFREKIDILTGPEGSLVCEFHKSDISSIYFYLRNNSWKPYVYIVFTTGRPLCHEVLPPSVSEG